MGRLGSKAFLPSTIMVTAPGYVKTLILELRVNAQVFVTLCMVERQSAWIWKGVRI